MSIAIRPIPIGLMPPYLSVDGVTDGLKDYPKEFQDQTPALAGYVFADGSDHRARGYFAQATRVAFDFHKSDLPHRGLIVGRRDPLGHDTTIVFDEPFHLLPVQFTDAAGLDQRRADYRVLQAHGHRCQRQSHCGDLQSPRIGEGDRGDGQGG